MTVMDFYDDVAMYVGGMLPSFALDDFHPAMIATKSKGETQGWTETLKAEITAILVANAPFYATVDHIQSIYDVIMEQAAILSPGEKQFLFTSLARAYSALEKGDRVQAAWHLLETEANRYGYWLGHQPWAKERQPLRGYGYQFPTHEDRRPEVVLTGFYHNRICRFL